VCAGDRRSDETARARDPSRLSHGGVELADKAVRGLAVHIGARVAALANASELWVSSTVKDLTAGSGIIFEDAGEHELKGVPDRWRLYRVSD
jgi:class 3 adenylate cyclase